MKKVLCTGTGGFIFSNFVRKAIKDKDPYEFVSIDKVTKTSVLNTLLANQSHRFYIGDVTDTHFLNVVFEFERPDVVIHGAAETGSDASNIDYLQSNIIGTQSIIDACRKWSVGRLLYISTDEVYGELKSESDASWTEDSPIAPRNPYAISKASGELLIKAAGNAWGLQYNIIRSCNNYGPRQSSDKLIPKIIKCVLGGNKIPIYGQGKQIRDWVHVQDNCSAILDILKNGIAGEIYNVSAGQEFSNIEVVHEICNALGKGHDLIEFISDRPAHDFRYSMNSSKLKELGWKPIFKFKNNGLNHTCDWYLNNKFYLRF